MTLASFDGIEISDIPEDVIAGVRKTAKHLHPELDETESVQAFLIELFQTFSERGKFASILLAGIPRDALESARKAFAGSNTSIETVLHRLLFHASINHLILASHPSPSSPDAIEKHARESVTVLVSGVPTSDRTSIDSLKSTIEAISNGRMYHVDGSHTVNGPNGPEKLSQRGPLGAIHVGPLPQAEIVALEKFSKERGTNMANSIRSLFLFAQIEPFLPPDVRSKLEAARVDVTLDGATINGAFDEMKRKGGN